VPNRVSLYLRAIQGARVMFRNWLPALAKFTIHKFGLTNGEVTVKCRNGGAIQIPLSTLRVLLYAWKIGVTATVDCTTGRVILLHHDQVDGDFNLAITPLDRLTTEDAVPDAVRNGWVFDGTYWRRYINGKGTVTFRHMYGPLLEVFDKGEFRHVNVKGMDVVDIGAFVGDSAIYFALRGAKRVIAVEPHPDAYTEMLWNIDLNKLRNVITPVNAGLASKPGKICIGGVNVTGTVTTRYTPGNYGGGDCEDVVPAVTLGELIEKYNIQPSEAILKMDCEGCEYDVIMNDYEHVRLFRELIFEHHAGLAKYDLGELTSRLAVDFHCMRVSGDMQIGIIHCVRKTTIT
jgi:FkbM family methyltransferase